MSSDNETTTGAPKQSEAAAASGGLSIPIGMAAGDVEREVIVLLGEVDTDTELEDLCAAISLDVPDQIKGDVRLLHRYLIRQLNSEDVEKLDDEGLSLYLTLYDKLTTKEDDKKKINTNVLNSTPMSQVSSGGGNGGIARRRPLFDMQKLKEFKIDGKIGGAADKPDTIQRFSSLKCQIDRAIKQDVSESTIIAAVLKAIPPNTKLRTFLENKTDLSVNEMLDYLKSHFHEQNYMLAFRELGDSVQDDKETAYDYVLGVFGMRDDVRNLAKKQGVTFDELLLRETTLNVIDTGLKNANIRYELKELTTFHPNKAIMDQVFLDAVSAAMDREQIRLKKRGEKKNRNLEVQSVQRQEKSERQEVNKRDGAVQARLAKQDKDIEGLSADVSEAV